MKRILILFTALFLISSCNLEEKAEFETKNISFNSQKGEQVIRISNKNFSVKIFDKISPFYLNEEVKDDSYYYYNDWITYIIPFSKRKVKVIVKSNTSNKKRISILSLQTPKGRETLRVTQS